MISNLGIRFVHYLNLQLFLSLIALPILIAWGIPFSLTSLIATALFAPFFTVFLVLSSVIFFTTLINLPNWYVIKLLDILSNSWLTLLSFEHGHIILPVVALPLWILLLLPCVTVIVIFKTLTQKPYICLVSLSSILLSVFVLSWLLQPTELTHSIAYNNQQVILLKRDNQSILIDPGCLAKRTNTATWVQYTLVPEIIRKTGSLTLDHVVALTLNQSVFKALRTLCFACNVKNIYIPQITGILSQTAQDAYEKLMQCIAQKHILLHEIATKTHAYPVLPEHSIYIVPERGNCTYQKAIYPKCRMSETYN